MSSSPFSLGPKILGTGALILSLFLLIGYLLPGTWEADATHVVNGTLPALHRFLDSPEGWQEWTPWPENGVDRSGAEQGSGAGLSWDDPDLGSGSFTLERVLPERVEYRVEVGSAAMVTHGRVTLTQQNGAVRLDWHEEGDLGRNPLMGYWARFMGRAQSTELAKGLDRLDSLATAGSAPTR